MSSMAGRERVLPAQGTPERRLLGIGSYRLLIAATLVILFHLPKGSIPVLADTNTHALRIIGLVSIVWSFLYLLLLRFSLPALSGPWRNGIPVAMDTALVIALLHYSDGLTGPFAILPLLLLVSTAHVLRGRATFLYVSVLVVLLLAVTFLDTGRILHAPPIGQIFVYLLALLAIAFLADSLVRSLERSDRLARQRGREILDLNVLNQEIIQQVDSGILVLDRQNRVVLSNPAAQRMTGYENWKNLPVALDLVQPRLALALRQHGSQTDSELSVAIGGKSTADAYTLLMRAIALPQGPYRLLILQDATALRERQREVQMAALGRLAANIAHEIRNPLSAVRHANQLLEELVTEPGSLHLFHIIERETLRISRIIDSVLEMARPTPAHPEPINASSWLPVMIQQLQEDPTLARLDIDLHFPPAPPVLFADPEHLRQIFTNLLANAALHGGIQENKIPVDIHIGRADHEGRILVTVRDHGAGIPADLMERIFEPFFTTDSRGTGLGLSMIRELLRLNQGTVSCRNHPESGAEFEISLPEWTC